VLMLNKKNSTNIKNSLRLLIFVENGCVNIKLCDVFRKIAGRGQFYFKKCHHVTCNLFK
jgi:hypothetical protein